MSSDAENTKHAWDAAIRELIAKGEASEDILSNSDSIISWWRNLAQAKQDEIASRVKMLSQSQGTITPTAGEKKRKMNWLERHPITTLVLGIPIAPFITFWVCFGLVNFIALFAPGIAAIMVPTTGLLCILSIVMVVQWYRANKKVGNPDN